VLSTQRAALRATADCYAPWFGLTGADRLLWPIALHRAFAHSLCVLGVISVGAGVRLVEPAQDPATLLRRALGGTGRSRSAPAVFDH